MIRVIFETNAGTFAGYLTSKGDIEIFENDNELPIAVIQPLPKRKAIPDVTADGLMRAIAAFLDQHIRRLEIDVVTARITPPGA